MSTDNDPRPLAIGTATASYQIEGGYDEDGRGPSIWDTFSATPGTVFEGHDGTVACDSYHRLDDDLALLSELGASCYRFSVAWPRIVPEGRGRVEPRGLDYYERLVDGLLAIGVEPMPTLYHWDLPQPLEDAGGWLERATAEAFAEYALVVHDRLGDRVTTWATHNEPWCAAYLGYASGVHAPGRKEGGRAHRAVHHLLLGHALTRQALPDTRLGIVLNLAPFWPESDQAARGAEQLDALRNRVWLDPLVDGAYDDGVLAVAPELSDPELVREGDLAAMRGSVDWLGINYYTPFRPRELAPGAEPHPDVEAHPGVDPIDLAVRQPVTDIGWEIDAGGLEELLVTTSRRTGLPLVVTENGAACVDDQPVEGMIDDQDRISYLRDHLAAVERARQAGADVRGYLVWTLLDNFEWSYGYSKKFGLVHVDRSSSDLRRTPKASFHWLRREIAQSAASGGPFTP